MNATAQVASEAVRLLRIADEGVSAASDAAALATSVAGLLGVPARSVPQRPIDVRNSEATIVADPAPRSWWQRLFARNR